jgi:hypothetical protein
LTERGDANGSPGDLKFGSWRTAPTIFGNWRTSTGRVQPNLGKGGRQQPNFGVEGDAGRFLRRRSGPFAPTRQVGTLFVRKFFQPRPQGSKLQPGYFPVEFGGKRVDTRLERPGPFGQPLCC